MATTEQPQGYLTAWTEAALEGSSLTSKFLLELTITPILASPSTLSITPYSNRVWLNAEELSSMLQSHLASSAQTSSSTSE